MLLTWSIWLAVNNGSKWQMGFNLVFKGLKRSGCCTNSLLQIWHTHTYIQDKTDCNSGDV